MSISVSDLYHIGMSPEKLADKVIGACYGDDEPSFPIDPFKMIREFGVIYQFVDFKGLEGIYILGDNEDDIPLIGINFNRPITRQRYTAAHELCHHIKDQNSKICPITGERNSVENYADRFSSALLMPIKYLKQEAEKYQENGYVSRDNALYMAEYFGVSFEACVFALAYRLNMLEGDMDAGKIKRTNRKFGPDRRRLELGLDCEFENLWAQIIDSYEFFWNVSNDIAWFKFKNDFIYHENRLERLDLDEDEVAEIVADIRCNKDESEYCKAEYKEIIEVAGHASMYDYIFETEGKLHIYSILDLHIKLYQFAPHPEAGGMLRKVNNFITDSCVETVEYNQIYQKLAELDAVVKDTLSNIDAMSVSRVVVNATYIHYQLTIIHPFDDGNGRCSRALLNWILRKKGIAPIYIKYPEKEEYYEALKQIDIYQDYRKLHKVIMREIVRSAMELNKNIEL